MLQKLVAEFIGTAWLVLGGCVQSSMAPQINAAAARVLDRIGISLIEVPNDGCCGSVCGSPSPWGARRGSRGSPARAATGS